MGRELEACPCEEEEERKIEKTVAEEGNHRMIDADVNKEPFGEEGSTLKGCWGRKVVDSA